MLGDYKQPWIWGWTRTYSDARQRFMGNKLKAQYQYQCREVFNSNYDILTTKTTAGLGVKRHGVSSHVSGCVASGEQS